MSNNTFKYSFSLLHIDYVKLNHNWNYNSVISPYYRIYYIDEGNGFISDSSTRWALEPGYLYLVPSFTICNLSCDVFLSQYFIQFFEESPDGISLFNNNRKVIKLASTELDVALIKKMLHNNPGRGINRSDNPKIYEKEAFYKEYRSLNDTMKTHLKFENHGILLQLISRFLSTKDFRTFKPQITSPKILDTMSYVQLNISENITVSQLARRVNQNQDYFSKQFLTHTGQRPMKYIHEKKIERAQYLIATSDKTFLEIALDTGFSNLPHFSKIFKQIVSLTPGEYRHQNNKPSM
ncbi:helix-turn-helix domain-containing protein [Flavobacterium pectinovorum]|uniref:AraC family transcriptional regulator n=1 Tax=Flavobacterium pectinovorum TaxID=29533 RepID=A0AB36P6L3_9FLAO|nr:AraC family transcriptional regulator [Flavobacterium pectinovorum]OXB08211.1 AraC family transcriptional regulator [Flavobacterium pectinovorum]SHN14840.1 Helix-turn-helix domain-containing protein [Flavobacterium pectinovorum]